MTLLREAGVRARVVLLYFVPILLIESAVS